LPVVCRRLAQTASQFAEDGRAIREPTSATGEACREPKPLARLRDERTEKIKNVFPLRSGIIPKHFRLDTISLVWTCMTEAQNPTFYSVKGNLVKYQDSIWDLFFKTNKKCFHRHKDNHEYTFDHMIETDGVSCCILLKRRDLLGKKIKIKKEVQEEVYIDELKDYTNLQDKNVVAIDPNMSDLLYCVNSDEREAQVTFRYTQDTRRKETKVKKYRNILQDMKKEVVDGKTVTEWEAELSNYNKKTLNFELFKEYLLKKNELNKHLETFYGKYLFRKLKLGSYMRRQITEARLLSHFEEKFGKPEETIITIGDFEQRKHRKFKEPVKGKGFRTLFRKAGYKVYLVDEYRTSCRCSACQGECATFRKCKNPRPWRSEEVILRHGLVMCKTCSRLWNRDTNASINIWKIAKSAINGLERPEYLKRGSIGSINDTTSVSSKP